MTQSQIEGFFFCHVGPHFEKIRDAATEEDAVAIARNVLDGVGEKYLLDDLRNAVKIIRSDSRTA